MTGKDKAVKAVDNRFVDKIIEKYRNKPGAVLAMLEEVQQAHENKYLPRETLEYIAAKNRITLSQIYSVVTFYSFFNLKPQGKHCIQVCRGTACHSKGSKNILEALYGLLGINEHMLKSGDGAFITTSDNMFTVRVVACFGQCALSPVVVVDDEIHMNLTVEKLKKILGNIKKAEKKK